MMWKVRKLEGIKVSKPYLLLVWSGWDSLGHRVFIKCGFIRKDFGRVEINCYRADFVQRLDHVLRQLDRGLADWSSTRTIYSRERVNARDSMRYCWRQTGERRRP